MKQTRFVGLLWLGLLSLVLTASPQRMLGASELKLPVVSVAAGRDASIPLILNATEPLRGFVAVIKWDPLVAAFVGDANSITQSALFASADQKLVKVDPAKGVLLLGAIMDFDPLSGDDKIIPAGANVLATFKLRGSAEGAGTPLGYVDRVYAVRPDGSITDNPSPTAAVLDNVVVGFDNLSQGAAQGLILTSGQLDVTVAGSGSLTLENAVSPPGATRMAVRVLADTAGSNVDGYSIAVRHDATKVALANSPADDDSRANSRFVRGTDADTPVGNVEFIHATFEADGVALAVILDFDAPYAGQTISGPAVSIARLVYSVNNPPVCDASVEPPVQAPNVVAALSFDDFASVRGNDDNLLVVGTAGKKPNPLNAGTVTFVPSPCPVKVDAFLARSFNVGGPLVRVARNLDGKFVLEGGALKYLTDGAGNLIPDEAGAPAPLIAHSGETLSVGFYYLSPPTGDPLDEDDPGSLASDLDDVQGLSMAARYSAELSVQGTAPKADFSTAGTITEAVGTEFIDVQFRNDPGAGGEIIIGLLVDQLPPFDGQTLPPTSDYLRVVSVDFEVSDERSACGRTGTIQFANGLLAAGRVPTDNVIAAMNVSLPVDTQFLFGTSTAGGIQGGATFVRGDCNFDLKVDIADPAAIISYLFLPGAWKFHPVCLDACDANDDGRVDLADTVADLVYLFKFGAAPPNPGPTRRGVDPTFDKLDCRGGSSCN